jgi:hypothetical protein
MEYKACSEKTAMVSVFSCVLSGWKITSPERAGNKIGFKDRSLKKILCHVIIRKSPAQDCLPVL